MDGSVYISTLKPINLQVPFSILKYPYLRQNISLELGPWMHTRDMYDIQMDNRIDNFTVMLTKENNSWPIENVQYELYKLTEAKNTTQDFNKNLYTRIEVQLVLRSYGLLVYTLIMTPNILIGFTAFFYRWIRLGQGHMASQLPRDQEANLALTTEIQARSVNNAERFGFLSSMLLVQVTLMLYVYSYLPSVDSVPYIVLQLITITIYICALLLKTIVCLRCERKSRNYEYSYYTYVKSHALQTEELEHNIKAIKDGLVEKSDDFCLVEKQKVEQLKICIQ